MRPTTIAQMIRQSSEHFGSVPALRVHRGHSTETTTYGELGHRMNRVASACVTAGLAAGDRAVIFAQNSPEWTIVDSGLLAAAVVPVPVYATCTSEQVRYILQHSGARMAFVGDAAELAKVEAIRAECPQVQEVVVLDAALAPHDLPSGVSTLAAFEAAGRGAHAEELAAREAATRSGDLATIIYTSGTTGDPKGVMLSHGNVLAELDSLDERFDLQPGERSMCFLPLSHALERGWTWYALRHGVTNCYVTNPKNVADEMLQIRPHMFVSVPRLYEKVYAVAHEQAGQGVTRRIFDWAFRVGRQFRTLAAQGRSIPVTLAIQHEIADRVVLHRVRDAVGGRKRVMACGGAPLRREVEEFFFAAGLLIYQGYGMTETAPLASCNHIGGMRFGTVGTAVGCCEIRIAPETSEILVRGGNVMLGYYRDPQATAEAIDADGWLHTGDVGRLDDDGYLAITDRIKDLIITAQGKNIAPAPIESQLEAHRFVENAIVVGDDRRYLTGLIQPAFEALETYARERGWEFADRTGLLRHPEVQALYGALVTEVGRARAKFERVQRFRLLPTELTMDGGEITPTLKVRRRAVERKFAHLIEEMYAER